MVKEFSLRTSSYHLVLEPRKVLMWEILIDILRITSNNLRSGIFIVINKIKDELIVNDHIGSEVVIISINKCLAIKVFIKHLEQTKFFTPTQLLANRK